MESLMRVCWAVGWDLMWESSDLSSVPALWWDEQSLSVLVVQGAEGNWLEHGQLHWGNLGCYLLFQAQMSGTWGLFPKALLPCRNIGIQGFRVQCASSVWVTWCVFCWSGSLMFGVTQGPRVRRAVLHSCLCPWLCHWFILVWWQFPLNFVGLGMFPSFVTLWKIKEMRAD